MTSHHPEQLDHFLDQALQDHFAAEPRSGLDHQISAALRDRSISRHRPIWPALVFAAVAACCVAGMIVNPHRTAVAPAGPQESQSHPPEASSAEPSHPIEIATRNEPHAVAVAKIHSHSDSKPLPKLPAFPSSSGLTPAERQLLALSRRPSAPPLTTAADGPITIAAIQIKPIQIPLIAPQPTQ